MQIIQLPRLLHTIITEPVEAHNTDLRFIERITVIGNTVHQRIKLLFCAVPVERFRELDQNCVTTALSESSTQAQKLKKQRKITENTTFLKSHKMSLYRQRMVAGSNPVTSSINGYHFGGIRFVCIKLVILFLLKTTMEFDII